MKRASARAQVGVTLRYDLVELKRNGALRLGNALTGNYKTTKRQRGLLDSSESVLQDYMHLAQEGKIWK